MRSVLLLPILGGLFTTFPSTTALPLDPDLNLTSPTLLPFPSLLTPRKYTPLPNPYEIRGSRISLDFDDTPAGALARSAVTALLARSAQHLQRHLQEHGDGEIPLGIQSFKAGAVEMMFASDPQFRVMRYRDLLWVVRGFRAKMVHEGYRERTAIVMYELENGQGFIETGEVNIAELEQLVATS